MFNIFLKTYEISFTQKVNMWIYYLRKLPLIGKKIPENIYNITKAKIIISIILKIFSFLFGFVKNTYIFLL